MVNYFSLDKTLLLIKLSSIAQSVEHAAVNRAVVGSSPTRGASQTAKEGLWQKMAPWSSG